MRSLLLLIVAAALAADAPMPRGEVPPLHLPVEQVTADMSVAVGHHAGGRLVGGLGLPGAHPWMRILPRTRSRGYAYGHARLVRALERAARHAGAVWPPGRVTVGNVAAEEGGRILPSRSHQTGLDADVVFPVVADDGPPDPERAAMESVRSPSEPPDERPTLDVPRAWALVESLLTDPEVEPLWLFVSRPIGDAIFEHAVYEGADPELVLRAAWLLHQPSDSLPHDDHLHVRVACAGPDRLAGCVDRGPRWPWLDGGRRGVSELVVGQLTDALRAGRDPADVLALATRAGVEESAPYALLLMNDADESVRSAASRHLTAVAPDQLLLAALAGVRPGLSTSDEAREAMGRSPGPLAAELAREVLAADERLCARRSARRLAKTALSALLLLPMDAAADTVARCARSGWRPLRARAVDVLARIACTPVPDGRRGEVIDELVTAIRSGPAERLVRLAQNYLGTRPDRVDPVDALLRLRAKLTEAGPDGMNARELVEGIRGDRVQTNLVSSRRRLKIWRNRLAEVEPAPATPQGQP